MGPTAFGVFGSSKAAGKGASIVVHDDDKDKEDRKVTHAGRFARLCKTA